MKPQIERIARKQYNNEQTPQLVVPGRPTKQKGLAGMSTPLIILASILALCALVLIPLMMMKPGPSREEAKGQSLIFDMLSIAATILKKEVHRKRSLEQHGATITD